MLNASGTGVTSDQFARNALRWLSPAGFPAAAWVEQVPGSRRAAYEARIGQAIVTPDERRTVVPRGSRSSYLPATLVSGFDPMAVPGTDLSGEPGMAAAFARATGREGVVATPVSLPSPGTRGLFLVGPAPNLIRGVLRPGYVVVFVSEPSLRSAAAETSGLQVAASGTSTGPRGGTSTVRTSFTAAGQRFDVVVPEDPVHGAAAILPWIILAGSLVLGGLAVALGVNATRRAKAQEELDRIFNLSSDVIAVADFGGRFTRVNPAAEEVLGYSEKELLAKPYVDFVHPDDRERTIAETYGLSMGKATLSFENRFVRKDGSHRVLEWTATPVVEDGVMYAMARDVTERRRAETAVERLANEQAALRRVATLVAKEPSPTHVFRKVAEEVTAAIGNVDCILSRVETDGSVTMLAGCGTGTLAATRSGSRSEVDGDGVTGRVLRAGRTCRIDDTPAIAEYGREHRIRSAAGSPIVVGGRIWGVVAVAKYDDEPLPPEIETRLTQFTDLVATAIANGQARAEVQRLAEEQTALRRVAALVAEGASPTAILDAVAAEMERLLDADQVVLSRYEPGAEVTVVAHRGASARRVPPGSRVSHDGETVQSLVRRTDRPARIEHFDGAQGALARRAPTVVVGAPIVVDGRPWGVISASWNREQSPPADTEHRMAQFAQLLDAAIANADSRDQLSASRVRLLTEGDEARRRVVRDLHDGAQQRLVHTIITLKLARRALNENSGEAESLLGEALEHAQRSNAELRELAHGILPTALTSGGLHAGVEAVVDRLDVPVKIDIPAERFSAEIEASAYFLVAEALTNVAKHAHATHAEVTVSAQNGTLRVRVQDDGVGGADPDGHGLVGVSDRVTALGGRLEIDSPAGGGTLVAATLPLQPTAGMDRLFVN